MFRVFTGNDIFTILANNPRSLAPFIGGRHRGSTGGRLSHGVISGFAGPDNPGEGAGVRIFDHEETGVTHARTSTLHLPLIVEVQVRPPIEGPTRQPVDGAVEYTGEQLAKMPSHKLQRMVAFPPSQAFPAAKIQLVSVIPQTHSHNLTVETTGGVEEWILDEGETLPVLKVDGRLGGLQGHPEGVRDLHNLATLSPAGV